MRYWNKDIMCGMSGRHLSSSAHARIQVLDIPDKDVKLWEIPHGEVLFIAVTGNCRLTVNTKEYILEQHDQAYLTQGEKFSLDRINRNSETLVQAIWMPGPEGCDICKNPNSPGFKRLVSNLLSIRKLFKRSV